MADDWQWFWASEQGRDRILRDELEGLQAQSALASARSARLNSQLTHLSGSIESRLSALSTAFDAYVELGDVREQLAGYPDTTAIRRDAASAIDSLSRGGTARPVDSRGAEYWLPHAVNAVAALVQGRPEPETERRAVELDRDAELFVVAAAGALGRGDQVASRVPDLLVCDGSLTAHQAALWSACWGGVYPAVLPEVGRRWSASLAGDADPDGWVAWLRDGAGSARAEDAMRWLDQLTSPAASTEPARVEPPVPSDSTVPSNTTVPLDPTVPLRAVVSELVARGVPGEAELLLRARELRQRIEHPGSGDRSSPEPVAPAGARTGTTVVVAVRQAVANVPPGSDAQRELLSWVSVPLIHAVGVLSQEAAAVEPPRASARTPGGVVSVSTDGPDPGALQRVRANVDVLNSPPTRTLYVSAALGALLAVLAVLAVLLGGSTALPVLLALGAAVAAVVVLVTLRERGKIRSDRAADLAAVDRKVEEAVAEVRESERDRQRRSAEITALSAALSSRLAAQAG